MVMVIIERLLYMLPQLLVTVGCIIYLSRGNKAAGILMLIGNLFGLLAGIFTLIVQCLVMSNSIEPVLMARMYTFVSPIWIITTLMFGVGFLIMAINIRRSSQDMPVNNSTADTILQVS